MFRRSRFSIRPNVGTTGRTAAAPQETPAVNKNADDTPNDVSESNTATSESENKSAVAQSEKPTTQGDGNDQNGEGASSSAAVQRRKRFSVKPRVAPGRPSVAARTQKSPVKAASETPVPDSEHGKPTPAGHTPTTETSKGPFSPRNRRLSEESKQAKTQPKPSLIPSDCSEPSVVAPTEDFLNKTPEGSGKDIESTTGGQMKEVHFKVPDKVPSSLPDKEAIAISERAKALVSSKTSLSPSPAAYTLSRLLNDPSDLQRLAKAQKLRELLKKEIHKEKRKRKASIRPKEFTLDPAKMTMRDLIHYLPESNPMTTSLEDPANPENETIVPPSPEREDSPERAQEPEAPPKAASPRVEDEEEEEEEAAEEEQEEALLVPQVKVAEDGSLIIDEESLTVEVQRAKGPNPAEDRDPIFERGSTTTYSSFRKGTYSKPWSSEETDMFFLAISMVGTDFSMICQLFPHRARSEIKNKFKKEERANAWRIDKAFRERRKLDIEYFSKLLEKILEVQKTRKKLKSLAEKNSPGKNKRKTKGKKAAKKLDDVEEEEEEEEDIPDLEGEEEGEKENEDLCNEGGTPASKPKRKRKRKSEQSASTVEPDDKKNKADKKSSENDEACIPEDAEAALPDDHADSELSEKTENLKACKDTAIKPAKLSRGRAPKPLLQLGRKRGKKPPTSPAKTTDAAADNGEKSVNDGATEEQTNEDASPKRQDNKKTSGSDDVSSEDEYVTDVHPPKPTRYGRTPKPTQPLNYPARNDSLPTSETTPTSPAGSATSASKHKPKCTAKKRKPSKSPSVQESKKPKLFTLRASQSEYSDDEENENQWEEEQQPECSSTRDSSAFVPASLRSPHPVVAEVEETVEELDILVNMPDVLGISQDALCPDATCKLAQNETGLAEPCEHQLDLLVDVIECLSSDYTVAEDESYNEAAHTLLTIGNLTHLSQLAENQTVTHDHAAAAGTASVSGENIASKPAAQDESSDARVLPVILDQGVTEMSESAATVEPHEKSKDDGEDVSAASAASLERSEKMSPQTRKGRSTKVKPKPNLGKASRSKKADCGQTHQEEASGSQDSSVDQITSGATTLDQNTSGTDCLAGAGIEEQATTESTDKILQSEISTANDSSDNLIISDVAVSTNTDSSPIQQSGDHPAPSVTPVKDLPASQREVSEGVSSPQTRKSRLQKPKPNLTKTARSAHSKPPITKDTEEKTCSPTPDPKCHEMPLVDAAAESTCTTSSEKSQSTSSAPELKQSVDAESSLAPTVGPSTPVEKEAAVALIESSVAVSDGRTSENRSGPKTSPESSQTAESTEETVTSPVQAAETLLGPGLDTDSAPVKDSSDRCASGKTPAGELHASQKEDSPRPAGKSRFQKIKPKPNIALASRMARSKLKTTGDTVEKSSNPTPNPDIHDKTTADREAEPAGITSSENTGCASDVMPSSDAAAALTTAEDFSATEEKKLDVGVPGQIESSTATPDQSAIQEKAAPGSSTDSAPSEERVEGSPVSQEKDSKVTLTCQTGESEKVEPEPHLTASSALSKTPTSEGPVTNQKSVEEPASATQNLVCDEAFAEIETQPTCSTTSPGRRGQREPSGTASLSELSLGSCLTQKPEELSSAGEQGTDAESEQVSTPEGSGRNVPLRRGRFARLKPNLASCTRKRSTRPQPDVSRKGLESRQADTSSDETSEQQSQSNSDVQTQLTEKDGEHLTSGNGSLQTEAVSSTQLKPAQSQPNIQSSEDASTESEIKPADAQSMSDTKEGAQQLCAENVPEVKSQDVIPQSSENDPPASQSDNESEPLKSSETSRKAPQASRSRLVKPKPNLGHCRRAQQQKAAQPKPDTAALSEGVDVSTGRATSEGHTDTQEPAEGATEQHIDKDSSEVVEQLSQLDFSQNVAGSSLSCLTQVDPSSQEGSTFSTGENQSQPNLTIFSDMLPEPVPSDPDEPFFILSLTEIPLAEVVGGASEPLPCLADASKRQQNVPGDVLGGASDGSHTDVAVPVSTENAAETGLINVKETEQDSAAYVGAVTENSVDSQASASVQPPILPETAAENEETEWRAENKTQRSRQRRANLQTKPKTSIEKPASEKTESTPTPLSESFAPSVEPESSEQTATKSRQESGRHADNERDALTGWKEPEDSGSEAEVKRAASRRKQKGSTSSPETKSTSPSSEAPPCKTAPKGPEAKTPPSVGQRSSTAPVASTSYDVTPTPAETRASGETVPTPSTVSPTREHTRGSGVSPNSACSTPCTAELLDFPQSDIQQSGSKAEEEEPTNVSQYFLSDIFTEVEDE